MQPCIDKGGYRGFGLKIGDWIHLGHDPNAPAGSLVFAIADGEVIFSDEVPGFGSYKKSGGVVVIKHKNKHGKEFIAVYGHVIIGVKKGENVKMGDVIGHVMKYKTKKFRADHLHFGINTKTELPSYPWGYAKAIGSWVDPLKYIEENC